MLQMTINKCSMQKFAKDRIRTAVFLCRKRPLSQLSYSRRCPSYSLSLSLSLSSFPSPSTSLSHFKSFSQFVWHLFSYHSLFHFELDLVFATYLRPTIFLLSNFKSLSPLDPFVCLSYVLACPLEDWIIFLSFLSRYLPIYHLTLSLNSLCS